MSTKTRSSKEADKTAEEVAEENVEATMPPSGEQPTGMEHWGEGGTFRIDNNGRRVRVKEKE